MQQYCQPLRLHLTKVNYCARSLGPILNMFFATARIHHAKQEAGNSMIRYQQVVFPLCTEIQLSVIAQFGFQPDGEGIIQVRSKDFFRDIIMLILIVLVHSTYQDHGERRPRGSKVGSACKELLHSPSPLASQWQPSLQTLEPH